VLQLEPRPTAGLWSEPELDPRHLATVGLVGEIARNLSVTETEWLQGIADRHGFPHAIVAYAPLQDAAVDAVLALFDAFEAITADFSESERDRLFRANAERIYRI
jgi:hypothetical protein